MSSGILGHFSCPNVLTHQYAENTNSDIRTLRGYMDYWSVTSLHHRCELVRGIGRVGP